MNVKEHRLAAFESRTAAIKKFLQENDSYNALMELHFLQRTLEDLKDYPPEHVFGRTHKDTRK